MTERKRQRCGLGGSSWGKNIYGVRITHFSCQTYMQVHDFPKVVVSTNEFHDRFGATLSLSQHSFSRTPPCDHRYKPEKA
jgi:hypothetical protein